MREDFSSPRLATAAARLEGKLRSSKQAGEVSTKLHQTGKSSVQAGARAHEFGTVAKIPLMKKRKHHVRATLKGRRKAAGSATSRCLATTGNG